MRTTAFFCAAALAAGAQASAQGVTFTDVTQAAGVQFKHTSGAFGKKYLPETMGAGVAFLDYDNDGWQDLLFANSKSWPGQTGPRATPALYRNQGNGTFQDVTKAMGLDVEIYGMGVAAADYDNDGRVDVYLTGVGGNRLFHNDGARFSDATVKAGVPGGGFATSAAFLDYDRDGALDLLVANYVEWTLKTDLYCTLDGKTKSYCTPESYKGQSATLYRGRGDGTFEDATKKAGLSNVASKALGISLLDFDSDGWLDVFLANDTQPNKLYRNGGDGTFKDVGMTAGLAFGETGVARAGMGTDAGDYDGSGRPSLVIGNFSTEMIALYHNEGNGLFIDEAPAGAIGKASSMSLTFSCFFLDYDLDGLLDVFAVNGHVSDDIEKVQPKIKYAQPPLLFRNLGGKRFDAVTAAAGAPLSVPIVGRGAAYGDYDNDGDLDLVVTANNGPARLLRNDGGNKNQWLRVKTVGAKANRDGIGARVTVTTPDGKKQWALVKTGSSYASQSELVLTFGLGAATKASKVEVIWPGGATETVADVAAGKTVTIAQGKGVVAGRP